MFTFGILAFLIGTIAFIISLFCLVIGKAMGVSVKGNVIMTLGFMVTVVVGFLCMGPISVSQASAQTSVRTISESAIATYDSKQSNDIAPTNDYYDAESLMVPVVTEPEYDDDVVDRVLTAEQDYTYDKNDYSSDTIDNRGNASNFDTWYIPENSETTESYVLNTNTHKVHYPGCRDVPKIAPQNYETWSGNLKDFFLANPEYSACKHCNPR